MIRTFTLLISLSLVAAVSNVAQSQTTDVREWLLPREDSAPSDPFVGPRGRGWFGTRTNYISRAIVH